MWIFKPLGCRWRQQSTGNGKKYAKLKGKKNHKDEKQCRKMWMFKPPGARWRQKSTGKRRKCNTKREKKIRMMTNNAEKCEYLAENYLLEFQKAWNVFLKGAGALWRQKSTESKVLPSQYEGKHTEGHPKPETQRRTGCASWEQSAASIDL